MHLITLALLLGSASAAPGLSKDQLDDTIREAMPSLRYCYQQALEQQPTLAGQVVVSLEIAAKGTVETAELNTSSLDHDEVESCILGKLEDLEFPAIESGTTQVRYPFAFAPG